MPLTPFLRDLLSTPGPSGQETGAGAAWRAGCEGFATEVGVDNVGSSFARVAGTAGGRKLIIVGHIDEIGVHVTHIDDNGFLRFGNVGGWDTTVLVGQRVRLLTRTGEVRGVIGRKPPHLLEEEERKRAPEIKSLHIDIGTSSAEETRELVRVGDMGVLDAEPLELRGDRIVSRSLDNRVGCYVAAEAARLVSEAGGAAGDVVAMAVTQEETLFGGSTTSAFSQAPDLAIAVDVGFETDQPGVELGQMSKHTFGSGPIVARGVTLNPVITEALLATAEREDIPHTLESLGRSTGTDADAINISRGGVPTGLISVPVRYMHTPVEMVAMADIDAAARLIAAYALALAADQDFTR